MRFYIDLNEKWHKEIIDYIKLMDRWDKGDLRNRMRSELCDYIENEIKTKKIKEKQRLCSHDFKEIDRTQYDENGERFFDDDGFYDRVERVTFKCKDCGEIKRKIECSEGRY